MGQEVEKLSGKLGIDTTDFKTALNAANRELRVLESGFKAGAAAMGDWSNNANGLEQRAKSLTSQIDIQKLKVQALRAEHERLATENGANSRAAQDAEIKLNKETETLNRMETELSGTESKLKAMKEGSDEAGKKNQELGDKTEAAGHKLETFKGILSGVGTVVKGTITALFGMIAAIGLIGGAIGGLVLHSASAADQLDEMSTKTGISVQRLQELDYVGKILGTDLETVTGAQARLVRSMFAAKDGTGAQADAFKELGVRVKDTKGNLLDQNVVFQQTIDALGKVKNPAEADALAMQIFGKSAQELNPLIKAGSAEMARLTEEAHKNGAVVSTETVTALANLQDQFDGLKLGLQGVGQSFAGAFAPFLSGVLGKAQGYLQDLVAIISNPDASLGGKANGIAGLIVRMVKDVANSAPQMLQAGLTMIQSLLNALISALPQLLPVAQSILKSLINFIGQNLPTLLNAGIEILLTLINAIVENLPMIVTAALQAIITLANGLTQALPILVPAIVQAIVMIVETLVQNLPLLINAAVLLLQALAQGLVAAIPILVPAIPVILQGLLGALDQALPMIFLGAVEIVRTLLQGIVDNTGNLVPGAVFMVVSLIVALREKAKDLLAIGKNFVESVWQGIKNAGDWFYSQIADFFSGMVDAALGALGMHSPSKKGIAIGKNFILSPIIGMQQNMAEVEGYFRSAFGRLATAAAQGASGNAFGLAGSSSEENNSFQFLAPVIIQGSTPPGSLGSILKGKRF